ncbi:MAG: hypothetical protein EXS05_04255 [Planctomycetaceae bacterium]|nr:hypothetical protein [Planctomycetaceae bacterium]
MTFDFGPWTTSLTTDTQLFLSAFWKGRLTRLPQVAAARPARSLCGVALLAFTTIVLAAAPLFLSGASAIEAALVAEPGFQEGAAAQPKRDVERIAKANDKIRRTLDKPTDFDFDECPLDEVLKYLKDYHNISIAPDIKAIKAAGLGLDETPITLKISGVSLRSVLKLLLEPLALSYYIEEDVLRITTRDVAAGHLEDVYYGINDIVRAGIQSTDLSNAVTQTIDPTSWQAAGGTCIVRAEPALLEVRQRARAHAQIEALLRDLRFTRRDIRGPLDASRREMHSYPIGDLRENGASDDDLFELLNGPVVHATRPERGIKSICTIEGDQLVVTNQTDWSHAATTALLSALREYRRAAAAETVARLQSRKSRWSIDYRRDLQTQVELDDAISGIQEEAKRRQMRRKLALATNVRLKNAPLVEVLKSLQMASGLDVIHTEYVELSGVSLEATVTLTADGVSMSDMLERILPPLKLDWYFGAGSIHVTSRADTANRIEPHVYRTKELLAAGHREKDLMATIASLIEPDSWAAAGGQGVMAPLPGLLVVTNNPRVHRKIEQFLESLEAGLGK